MQEKQLEKEGLTTVLEMAKQARMASQKLASLDDDARKQALLAMASAIAENKDELLKANAADMENAQRLLEAGEITQPMVSRLKLSDAKIDDIINGIKQVASLPDPLKVRSMGTELDSGLELYRVSAPIGVLAIIFESRPDALPQIASLCMKTGNAVLLKGGKEAENSNKVLFNCLTEAGRSAGLPEHSMSLLNTREDVAQILKADGYVDLIIPRGSNSLVRHIQDNTRIPVLGHADGICHLYVHEDADLEMAVKLTIDSKTQYPSACNALETLLIHEAIGEKFIDKLLPELKKCGVETRLDGSIYDALEKRGKLDNFKGSVKKAEAEDWSTEYCDLILSVKEMRDLDEAVEHINQYGSGHTDCIVTPKSETFEKFFDGVNSAGVYHNASTRFADGFRYGFGAEVGIATGKMHPRGPVGLEGIVTYKYRLEGSGQIVADYSGENGKQFSHKQLI